MKVQKPVSQAEAKSIDAALQKYAAEAKAATQGKPDTKSVANPIRQNEQGHRSAGQLKGLQGGKPAQSSVAKAPVAHAAAPKVPVAAKGQPEQVKIRSTVLSSEQRMKALLQGGSYNQKAGHWNMNGSHQASKLSSPRQAVGAGAPQASGKAPQAPRLSIKGSQI